MAITFDDINKIIEVESPATEITIQELLNEIRGYEDDLVNLDLPNIASASGKQFLGGTTYVGITLELLDGWRVKFEDRPGTDYVQCSVTGGNIVAYDESGVQQFPLAPSTYVFATITASASATLQEQDSLQYASFNGGVWVDVVNGTAGTSFPIGTPQEPVSNLTDAMTILESRGFTTIYALGDLVVDDDGDYAGVIFIGESITRTTFTVSSGANVTNCEFHEATVQGTLDGNSYIQSCRILNLNYVYGIVELCLLQGTITLAGSNSATFLDCWSGTTDGTHPIIDCGGAGQALSLRNYNGCLEITNKTGTEYVTVDLNSGEIILAATVTNGTIVIRGIGCLTDSSTGTTIDITDLISNHSISDAVWDELTADHTITGSTGKAITSTSGLSEDEHTQLMRLKNPEFLDDGKVIISE